MLKLLVLILLAWLVYRGIESVLRQLRGASQREILPPPPPRVTVMVHRDEEAEELVPCSRCGVRVPKSRMVAGEGGVVCGACSASRG